MDARKLPIKNIRQSHGHQQQQQEHQLLVFLERLLCLGHPESDYRRQTPSVGRVMGHVSILGKPCRKAMAPS